MVYQTTTIWTVDMKNWAQMVNILKKVNELPPLVNIFHCPCPSLFIFHSMDHMSLVSSGKRTLLNNLILEEPMHSECVPFTSAMASQREDAATTSQQRPKRMPLHERLTREFNVHKMKYLKEEHEMKMRILQLELDIKLEERAASRKKN